MNPSRLRSIARATAAVLLIGLVGGSVRTARASEEDLLDALGDVALFVETEVLVAGATRRVAKLSEAPGTITVISREELVEQGVLTLEEALRLVTSLTFSPGTIALTPEIRDIEQAFGNKILLLVDGRLVNGVFRGNFFVDLSQPIDNVARVEVVRGPGSALYGANAQAGFINVITRRGDEIEGVELRATAGGRSLRHLAVVAGNRAGEHAWSITARHAAADGFDPVNPDSPNAEHDDVHLAGHWGRGTSQGETWFLDVSYTDVEAGVSGRFEFPTPGDELRERRLSLDFFRLWEPSPTTKLKLRTYYNRQDNDYTFLAADLALTPLSDLQLGMIGGVVYDSALQRVSVQPNPQQEPDDEDRCVPCDDVAILVPGGGSAADYAALAAGDLPTVVDGVPSDEWLGFAEVQADWQVSRSNYLLGGISFRLDDLTNGAIGARRFENYALFVEDEQRFLRDELILLGSLRLDDHSFFGLSVSPRVSLIWSPNEHLILKSAYGKAFRSPNFVELFGATRIGTASIYGQRRAVAEGLIPDSFVRTVCLDPDCTQTREITVETELEQEEIETVELWTEYAPVDRFKVILNLYRFEIANEVGVALDRNDVYFLASPTGAADLVGIPWPSSLFAVPGLEDVPTFGVFLNAPDRTEGYGAELELSGKPWDWLSLAGSYSRRVQTRGEVRSFVEEDDTSNEQRLVPTFGTREFFVDQAVTAVTFRHRERFWASLRLRFLGRPDDSIFSRGGATTADITLGLRWKNLSAAASVWNLNEGGTLFDPTADDFVETDRDLRFTLTYKRDL